MNGVRAGIIRMKTYSPKASFGCSHTLRNSCLKGDIVRDHLEVPVIVQQTRAVFLGDGDNQSIGERYSCNSSQVMATAPE